MYQKTLLHAFLLFVIKIVESLQFILKIMLTKEICPKKFETLTGKTLGIDVTLGKAAC